MDAIMGGWRGDEWELGGVSGVRRVMKEEAVAEGREEITQRALRFAGGRRSKWKSPSPRRVADWGRYETGCF